MKRPQFGIRLMLLVVTLLAMIFAWRNAVWTVERPEELRLLRDEYHKLDNLRSALLSTSVYRFELAKIEREMTTIEK